MRALVLLPLALVPSMAMTMGGGFKFKTFIRRTIRRGPGPLGFGVQNGGARPAGGAGGSFWKKLEMSFSRTQDFDLMPGTFNPRIAKHMAMRWSYRSRFPRRGAGRDKRQRVALLDDLRAHLVNSVSQATTRSVSWTRRRPDR